MIEVVGNLWTYPADFRVITTNGTIRRDGCAVMGRGCAREAAKKFPRLPHLLGERIGRHGNNVHFFSDQELDATQGLFTFPVKHHWHEMADVELIRAASLEFARQLRSSATYVLPRPGCGNGGLVWEAVQPLISHLPDNVYVIDFAR